MNSSGSAVEQEERNNLPTPQAQTAYDAARQGGASHDDALTQANLALYDDSAVTYGEADPSATQLDPIEVTGQRLAPMSGFDLLDQRTWNTINALSQSFSNDAARRADIAHRKDVIDARQINAVNAYNDAVARGMTAAYGNAHASGVDFGLMNFSPAPQIDISPFQGVNRTLGGFKQIVLDELAYQGSVAAQSGDESTFAWNGIKSAIFETLMPGSAQEILLGAVGGVAAGRVIGAGAGYLVQRFPTLGENVGTLAARGVDWATDRLGPPMSYGSPAAQIGAINPGAVRIGGAAAPSFNPAIEVARAHQIASGYKPDNWVMIDLPQGTVVYQRTGSVAFNAGPATPVGPYFTDLGTLQASSFNAGTLAQAVQASPHPIYGFRPDVTGFRLTQGLRVPNGLALNNPALGPGGGAQYFFDENMRLYLERVASIDLGMP